MLTDINTPPFSCAPRITVAMPVYNAGSFLLNAVRSIQAQTVTEWELLLIDDGSTDGAVDAIEQLADARIRILRDGTNRGLAARLNEAIDAARGRFLARMDQDDISFPQRFERQLALLDARPEIDLTAAWVINIDEDDKPLTLGRYPLEHATICAAPWKGIPMPHPVWMGRIDWFRQNRYAVPGPFFCEDQELLLRAHAHSRYATVDEVLFAYRVRRRNNWSRVIRTRSTLALIQIRLFASQGPRRFIAFTGAYCAALLVRDGLRMLRERWGGLAYPDTGASEEQKTILHTVLFRLEQGSIPVKPD
jgi:glycosyltransferase involved in cell wall biosynthesis